LAFLEKFVVYGNNNRCLSSGVHKLTRPDCGETHFGQTGRGFSRRFKEHNFSFRSNNTTLKFVHPLENGHSCGKMQNIMQLPHLNKRVPTSTPQINSLSIN